MNGFLLIDKPSGISSAQCVSRIKKILNEKKVGHCGTLDPLATGVLALALGKATKTVKYIMDNYLEIQKKMEKNDLPTKEGMIKQISEIINL